MLNLIVQLPFLIPNSIGFGLYLFASVYFTDIGAYSHDIRMEAVLEDAKTIQGACLAKSVYMADIMTIMGISGHKICFGKFSDDSNVYHVWVEYHGAIWDANLNGIKYGIDRTIMTNNNLYQKYGEMDPYELDLYLKFDSPKQKEWAYYLIGMHIVYEYEKKHNLKPLVSDET